MIARIAPGLGRFAGPALLCAVLLGCAPTPQEQAVNVREDATFVEVASDTFEFRVPLSRYENPRILQPEVKRAIHDAVRVEAERRGYTSVRWLDARLEWSVDRWLGPRAAASGVSERRFIGKVEMSRASPPPEGFSVPGLAPSDI